MKAVAIYEALPPDSNRFVKQSQDKGASSWVNVIPLEDEGINDSKEEFIEKNVKPSLPLLPVTCVCSRPNNLTHALHPNVRKEALSIVDTIT